VGRLLPSTRTTLPCPSQHARALRPLLRPRCRMPGPLLLAPPRPSLAAVAATPAVAVLRLAPQDLASLGVAQTSASAHREAGIGACLLPDFGRHSVSAEITEENHVSLTLIASLLMAQPSGGNHPAPAATTNRQPPARPRAPKTSRRHPPMTFFDASKRWRRQKRRDQPIRKTINRRDISQTRFNQIFQSLPTSRRLARMSTTRRLKR